MLTPASWMGAIYKRRTAPVGGFRGELLGIGPRKSTIIALSIMNGDNIATFWTSIFFFLFFEEFFHAFLFNFLEISDHAHPISCPVTLIQSF